MRIINGSLLIIESAIRAGVDVYVGYPITPSNWLYFYGVRRARYSLPAPDEITTLQWMSGLSASGKLPMTATSFPGFALMIESINMAYMMELPMLIVLVQRLGPSTGSATTGAQGDLMLLRYLISGGYNIPVFSPSSFYDCWILTAKTVETAVKLRSPVILLTSKEMVMTNKSFDIENLPDIKKVEWEFYDGKEQYFPYKPVKNFVPAFLPVDVTFTGYCNGLYSELDSYYIENLCAADVLEVNLYTETTGTNVIFEVSGYCPNNPNFEVRPTLGVWFRPADNWCWRYAYMYNGYADLCNIVLGEPYVIGIVYDGHWTEYTVTPDYNAYIFQELELTDDICTNVLGL